MSRLVQVVMLMLLVAGCTLSLAATTLDRAQRPATPAVATAVDSVPSVNLVDIDRQVRPMELDLSTFTLERPGLPDGQFTIPPEGGYSPMSASLSRPNFQPRRDPMTTPEPGSLVLLASGLLSGVYFVRRRK